MEHTPVTQEYLIDLYRSLIIKRDELKNNVEENEKKYYQMFRNLYKEYYEINFECNDSDNCISENLIHNGIKRRGNISNIGITNKKIYLALIEKFNYLKKISSKI